MSFPSNVLLPFLGRPLPFPRRDFLSISLLLGLVGAAALPLSTSPLSLRESPRPESLEEFFLSFRLAFALRRASWMLDDATQPPLTSVTVLLETDHFLSPSSPDETESLRSSASVQTDDSSVWFVRFRCRCRNDAVNLRKQEKHLNPLKVNEKPDRKR